MWILLVFISTVSSYDASISSSQISVEFNSKEACVSAANEWYKLNYSKDYKSVKVLYTPKG
jgi:hypothetical protein